MQTLSRAVQCLCYHSIVVLEEYADALQSMHLGIILKQWAAWKAIFLFFKRIFSFLWDFSCFHEIFLILCMIFAGLIPDYCKFLCRIFFSFLCRIFAGFYAEILLVFIHNFFLLSRFFFFYAGFLFVFMLV